MGFARITGLSVGQASIIVGFIILAFVAYNRVAIGLGTLLNMVLIGIYFDLIIYWQLIPLSKSLVLSLAYALISMILVSLAIYYYAGTGYGAGPRDSLFFFVNKKYNLSLGSSRIIIESIAVLFGYLMGGKVGMGTLIFAFVTGYIMNGIFKLLKFDPKMIVHRSLFKGAGSL